MQQVESINLIATDPNIRNGRPCIVGTGLRVTDIVIAHLFHDRTPSELASDYMLSMGQVYAALAYYYLHKDALDEDIRQQIAKARQYSAQQIGSRHPSLIP